MLEEVLICRLEAQPLDQGRRLLLRADAVMVQELRLAHVAQASQTPEPLAQIHVVEIQRYGLVESRKRAYLRRAAHHRGAEQAFHVAVAGAVPRRIVLPGQEARPGEDPGEPRQVAEFRPQRRQPPRAVARDELETRDELVRGVEADDENGDHAYQIQAGGTASLSAMFR